MNTHGVSSLDKSKRARKVDEVLAAILISTNVDDLEAWSDEGNQTKDTTWGSGKDKFLQSAKPGEKLHAHAREQLKSMLVVLKGEAAGVDFVSDYAVERQDTWEIQFDDCVVEFRGNSEPVVVPCGGAEARRPRDSHCYTFCDVAIAGKDQQVKVWEPQTVKDAEGKVVLSDDGKPRFARLPGEHGEPELQFELQKRMASEIVDEYWRSNWWDNHDAMMSFIDGIVAMLGGKSPERFFFFLDGSDVGKSKLISTVGWWLGDAMTGCFDTEYLTGKTTFREDGLHLVRYRFFQGGEMAAAPMNNDVVKKAPQAAEKVKFRLPHGSDIGTYFFGKGRMICISNNVIPRLLGTDPSASISKRLLVISLANHRKLVENPEDVDEEHGKFLKRSVEHYEQRHQLPAVRAAAWRFLLQLMRARAKGGKGMTPSKSSSNMGVSQLKKTRPDLARACDTCAEIMLDRGTEPFPEEIELLHGVAEGGDDNAEAAAADQRPKLLRSQKTVTARVGSMEKHVREFHHEFQAKGALGVAQHEVKKSEALKNVKASTRSAVLNSAAETSAKDGQQAQLINYDPIGQRFRLAVLDYRAYQTCMQQVLEPVGLSEEEVFGDKATLGNTIEIKEKLKGDKWEQVQRAQEIQSAEEFEEMFPEPNVLLNIVNRHITPVPVEEQTNIAALERHIQLVGDADPKIEAAKNLLAKAKEQAEKPGSDPAFPVRKVYYYHSARYRRQYAIEASAQHLSKAGAAAALSGPGRKGHLDVDPQERSPYDFPPV